MFKHPTENRFNMIEIIIAMSIMVVVIVSVLSLVPKALWSNQEAVSSIAAGDTADQFLNYFAGRLENNWGDLSALPESKFTGEQTKNPDGTISEINDESDMVFSTYGMMTDSRLNIFYEAPSETSDWDPAVSDKGIFKVQLTSASNHVDFEGYMRVWKTATEMATGDASPKHITLHTEVSWPTSLPYEKRRKKTYDLQVFQPGSVIKEASAINDVPCQTVWGIEGSALYYYTLSDEATQTVVKEGDIKGLSGVQADALTCAPNGNVYFINNDSSEKSSTLYKISRGSIDGDSSTDVSITKVGETGLSGSDRITAMQFANNKLFALTYTSQKVYEVNYYDGTVTKIADMDTKESSFTTGGMAIGVDGYVYIARQLPSKSELWRFDTFPDGTVSQVMVVKGSGSIESIAGHPSGWVFMYDNTTCYRVEPFSGLQQDYLNFTSKIADMDFYYLHEANDCSNERACEGEGKLSGDVSLNPTGSSDYDFEMTTAAGVIITRDDLQSYGANYEFNGKAVRIEFKPKATGQQDLTLDGDPYTLNNSIGYTLWSEVPFGVRIYNENGGKGASVAMGRWLMELTDAPLRISFCPDDGGNTIDGSGGGGATPLQVVNGAVVPTRDSKVTFQVAKISHTQGGKDLPVTLSFSVAGKSYTPFGSIGDPGNSINGSAPGFNCPDTVPAGSGVSALSAAYDSKGALILSYSSSPSTSNVLVLTDGDMLPDGSRVALADNQALMYFELKTTNPAKMAYDTLILQVTVNPL